MTENLILVDERNRAVGTATKHAAHRDGLLHRAFSIFLVDGEGRFLLQRRHPRKYHSGGLWANSCCGHPRIHERTLVAARRRLGEELGVAAALRFGFFARYRSELDNGMHENEFVYVYFGALAGPVAPHADEIIEIDFLTPREIAAAIAREPHAFTYWLKYYFQAHADDIERFARHVGAPEAVTDPSSPPPAGRGGRGGSPSRRGAAR